MSRGNGGPNSFENGHGRTGELEAVQIKGHRPDRSFPDEDDVTRGYVSRMDTIDQRPLLSRCEGPGYDVCICIAMACREEHGPAVRQDVREAIVWRPRSRSLVIARGTPPEAGTSKRSEVPLEYNVVIWPPASTATSSDGITQRHRRAPGKRYLF